MLGDANLLTEKDIKHELRLLKRDIRKNAKTQNINNIVMAGWQIRIMEGGISLQQVYYANDLRQVSSIAM